MTASDDSRVVLPRRQVRGLYRAVVALVAGVLLVGAPLVGLAFEQDDTNAHLRAADARQAETDRRLRQLIEDEAREDEAEDAQACADQWARVPQLRHAVELAVRKGSGAGAGAVLDVATQLADNPLPPETNELLEAAVDERVRPVVSEVVADYPDPPCDFAAALVVLDRADRNKQE